MAKKQTRPDPLLIPRYHLEAFRETMVGMMRVAESLDATASAMRDPELGPRKGDANEIGMWAIVLQGLRSNLDKHLDSFEAEPEAVLDARLAARRIAGV